MNSFWGFLSNFLRKADRHWGTVPFEKVITQPSWGAQGLCLHSLA